MISLLFAALIGFVVIFSGEVASADVSRATHCSDSEGVLYSCSVGGKVVSICVAPREGRPEAIEYRYGVVGNVEMTYRAQNSGKQRFFAAISPVSPRAQVSQLWFDRGAYRYLVSQCEGGDCPVHAGIIVYRAGVSLQSRRCSGGSMQHGLFNPKVIDFNLNTGEIQAKTDLIVPVEVANDLKSLYPYRFR